MKKTFYIVTVLFLILLNHSYAQKKDSKIFYQRQFGLELGLGDNSAPGTSFPFGGSISAYGRKEHHVLGLRISSFSELDIFGTSIYYNLTGPFYGYSFQKKNVNIIPQATLGLFKTNYGQNYDYTGIGFELSASANLHKRGLGIGVRPLINVNQIQTYVGFVFHLLLGREWNPKNKDSNAIIN